VTLSGGGIGFLSPRNFAVDDILKLKIILQPILEQYPIVDSNPFPSLVRQAFGRFGRWWQHGCTHLTFL
jgi:hypothetical protein